MAGDDWDETPLQDYPNRTVWTTWAISYQAVQEKHEGTARLLLLWSFLDNKDLWYDLFAKACSASAETAKLLLEWIGDISTDELTFSRAMKLLRSYSLIEELEATTSYAAHPLVHLWAFHYRGKHQASRLGYLAVITMGGAIYSMCKEPFKIISALQRRMLPHAQAVLPLALEQLSRCSEDDIALLDAALDLGRLLTGTKKFAEAKEILSQLLQVREENFGSKHHGTLVVHFLLGTTYLHWHNFGKAERAYERVLDETENAFERQDPLVLDTINNLGEAYISQGKQPKAEQLYKRVLQDVGDCLWWKNKNLKLMVSSLSFLYVCQGKLLEAEHLLKQGLKEDEEPVGSQDEDTLRMAQALGDVYRRQGKLKDAEKVLNWTLQGCEETLGPDNYLTLNALEFMGKLYWGQGKFEEAKQMFQRYLQGCKDQHGYNHPETSMALCNLGITYGRQGKLIEAERTLKQSLQGLEEVFGDELIHQYPAAFAALENLGCLYEIQGCTVEAKAMYSRALQGVEILYGQSSDIYHGLSSRIEALQAQQSNEEPAFSPSCEQNGSETCPQKGEQGAHRRKLILSPLTEGNTDILPNE